MGRFHEAEHCNKNEITNCFGGGKSKYLTKANEKYKDDAILQNKFTVDFFTKKQKVNEGEVPQYYVVKAEM